MKYDVVIPYRENKSLELQYTVRGIMKNLPYNNIHIIGDGKTGTDHVRHAWVNRPSVYMNVESKVIQACEELITTDYFWFSNDDFFIMQERDSIPVFHKGTLQEAIMKRKYRDSYTIALMNTSDYLKSQGIKDPLNYELHIPMLFNTRKRLAYFNLTRPIWRRKDLLMRSIYGNLEELGGELVADVKDVADFIGKPFLSTSDGSFANWQIGQYIREELS